MKKRRSKSQAGFLSADSPLPRISSAELQSTVEAVVKELHATHLRTTLSIVDQVCSCDSKEREDVIKKYTTAARTSPACERQVTELIHLLKQNNAAPAFDHESKVSDLENKYSSLASTLPTIRQSLSELRETCRLVKWRVKYMSEVEPFKIWMKIARWVSNNRLSVLETENMKQHDTLLDPENDNIGQENHLAALRMCQPLLDAQNQLHALRQELERYTKSHSDDEQEVVKKGFSRLQSKVAVVVKALKVGKISKSPTAEQETGSLSDSSQMEVSNRRQKRSKSLFQTNTSSAMGLPAIAHKRKSLIRHISLLRRPSVGSAALNLTDYSKHSDSDISYEMKDLLQTISTLKQHSVDQTQRITALRAQTHHLKNKLKAHKEAASLSESTVKVDLVKPPPTGLSASKLEKRLFAVIAELASVRERLEQERELVAESNKIAAENTALKNELEKLTLEYQREQAQMLSLSTRFTEQQARLDQVISENLEVQDQSEHFERIIDNLENRNALLVSEIASAQKRTAKYQVEADGAVSKVFDLQEKLIEGFSPPLPYSEDYHNEVHRLKNVLAAAENDKKSQAKEIEELKTRLNTTDQERHKLKVAVSTTKKSHSESQQHTEDLIAALKNELVAANERCQSTEQQLRRTESKLKELIKKIGGNDAVNYVAALEEATARQVSTMRNLLAEAERKNQALTENNAELEVRIQKLTQQAADQSRLNESQMEVVERGKKRVSLLERRISELTFDTITKVSVVSEPTSVPTSPIATPVVKDISPASPSLNLSGVKTTEMSDLIKNLTARCQEAERQLAQKDQKDTIYEETTQHDSNGTAELLSKLLTRCENAEEKYAALSKASTGSAALSKRVAELEAVLGGADSVHCYSFDATTLLDRLHCSERKAFPSDLLERCHAAERQVARLVMTAAGGTDISDQAAHNRRKEVALMLRSFQQRCHTAENENRTLAPEAEQQRQCYVRSTTLVEELNTTIRNLEKMVADRDVDITQQASVHLSENLSFQAKQTALELHLQYQELQMSFFIEHPVAAFFRETLRQRLNHSRLSLPIQSFTVEASTSAIAGAVMIAATAWEQQLETIVNERRPSIFNQGLPSEGCKTPKTKYITTTMVNTSSSEKSVRSTIVPMPVSPISGNLVSGCQHQSCEHQKQNLKDRLTIATCRVHELEILLKIEMAKGPSQTVRMLGQFSVIEKDGRMLNAPPPSPEVENSKRVILKDLQLACQGATLSTAKFNEALLQSMKVGHQNSTVVLTCVGCVLVCFIQSKVKVESLEPVNRCPSLPKSVFKPEPKTPAKVLRHSDMTFCGSSPCPPPIPWSLDSQITHSLVCSGCGSNMQKPVSTSLSLPPWFSWDTPAEEKLRVQYRIGVNSN